jgi:hypothetical protein
LISASIAAPPDERGIADHAHLTVAKANALILGFARSHRFKPGRLGVGDGGGVGVEKLIVCKTLHSLPVSSNHRRKALVFQGENFTGPSSKSSGLI